MASSNYISNVAVVGAGGNSGRFMTEALLKTGKHNVTAITRSDSQTQLPDGVAVKKVDYDNADSLVEALKGQDALVITLGAMAPHDLQDRLIKAAGDAGVRWILPNEWGPDTANEKLVEDVTMFKAKVAIRKLIQDLGKSSFIGVSTGFWYEWSLSIAPAFGIDLINHKATLFGDGTVKISTSTWPQVGRTVAGILSLPIKPEGSNQEASLESLRNKVVYAKSFTASQKEMLESAYRVTGTKESDWTISKQSAQERFTEGLEEMQKGERIGLVKVLYARVFYPDSIGDIESRGTLNKVIGLPEEDIDEATRVALERASGPQWVDGN